MTRGLLVGAQEGPLLLSISLVRAGPGEAEEPFEMLRRVDAAMVL
jgi:hypothetical protein